MMNDLIEQYKAQIEALQKELEKKTSQLDQAVKLAEEIHVMLINLTYQLTPDVTPKVV